MRTDNSRHLTKAARERSERTRRRALTTLRIMDQAEEPITVSILADRAAVSRSWLYSQPDILDQIRQAPAPSPTPATQRVPSRQTASADSLRQRLHLAHQRIRDLETDNQQLRHALAQALGDQRSRHAREPQRKPVTNGPCH